jgi:hypothetical protein
MVKQEASTASQSAQEISQALWENPSKATWESFAKALPGSEVKYYKVFFPAGLDGALGLKGGYVMLYGDNYRQLFKVPVMMKEGKKSVGATIYLKELELNRKQNE